MRLTSVVLHSPTDLTDIEFSTREAQIPSRYIVRQILGIDAEELVPKFYGRGLVSGTAFHEFVMKPRDVVIRVALNPKFRINENVSDLRDELYKIVSSNRTGQFQIQFRSGATLVCVISGRITKFEVGHFNKLPEVQITINCPDPTLRSIHPIDYAPAVIPVVNPISMPDSASTAPHGLSFRIKFTATTTDLIVQDKASSPDWMFKVTPSGGFAVDDELVFSSEFGNKQLYIDGVSPVHLMDKVSDDSVWPTIFPGGNIFYFLPIANFDWMEFKYFSAYWGL